MFYLPSTQSTVIKGLKNYFPDLNNANKLWKNPLAQSFLYFLLFPLRVEFTSHSNILKLIIQLLLSPNTFFYYLNLVGFIF